ncbi:MAG: alpha/beta hydrolase-fold protein [Xylophilus ampelinus]
MPMPDPVHDSSRPAARTPRPAASAASSVPAADPGGEGGRRRLLAAFGALGAGAALGGCAWRPGWFAAAPAVEAPAGAPTVADAGSPHYRFARMTLPSADGRRRYRLQIAVPTLAPPAPGYPAIYLLDGNAAFAALDAAQLAALAATGRPPVIAAIGYDTQDAFDVVARAYDYTPPVPGEQPTMEDAARGRLGGGADRFLDLLLGTLRPAVRDSAAIDPRRETLWGHSYGGLFVLHTLFTRPASFARYAAADPSLWWHGGFILREEDVATPMPPGPPRALLVMTGGAAAEVAADGPRPARPGVDPAQAERARALRRSVPPDAARRMVARLAARPGLTATLREFPGVGHGPMLAASLGPALEWAVR